MRIQAGNEAARRVAWKRRHLMWPPLSRCLCLLAWQNRLALIRCETTSTTTWSVIDFLGPQISESAAWVTSLRFSFVAAVAAAAFGHESVRPRQECLKFVAWVFCFSLRLRLRYSDAQAQRSTDPPIRPTIATHFVLAMIHWPTEPTVPERAWASGLSDWHDHRNYIR